ncbi:MAG: hypothetical protein AABW48_02935 [Nanoarchaeota archaeon]
MAKKKATQKRAVKRTRVKISKAVVRKARPKWHAAPLKGSFMVLSILGFLISAYLVEEISYKISFMLIFAGMFAASIISMTKAPVIEGNK